MPVSRRPGTHSEPARVVILVDELEAIGGTELHLLALVQGLRQRGLSVQVLVMGRRGLAARYPPAGLELVRWRVRRGVTPGYLRDALKLARWLRATRCDLVQSVHTAADLLAPGAARLAGRLRCVSSRRDLGGFRQGRHRLMGRLVNRWVDAFIGPSQAVCEAAPLPEGVAPRRGVVIPNRLDQQRVPPPQRSSLRGELNLGAHTPVVGNVASLTPAKQPVLLVESFAQLATGPWAKAHLVLAGEGPLRGAVESRARALGVAERVHLLGARTDPEAVYAALDVLILPSRSEGLPNTLLEAMACGLPVVASAVGGITEVVRHGHTGLLVERPEPCGVADAARTLLEQPDRLARMAEAARHHVARHYSLDAMVDAHMRLYLSLLGRRAGAHKTWPLARVDDGG